MKPYYEDEHVTLYHADSRELLPELPLSGVDMLCTDPPYAAAAATVTTGMGKAKWGGNWGDMSLVSLLAEQALNSQVIADEHQVFWFADHLSYAALIPTFFRRYPLVQNVVWDKDMMGVGAAFRKQTELIIYARTTGAPNPASKSLRDLVRIKPDYASKEHPAAKPLPLMEHLLGETSWRLALDPFAGSGTTLLAAKRLGRRAVGVEIEERYCEVAARRLSRELTFGGAA
jgi:site-specific DNA-methyltransferase (adenine-specific)